MDIRRKATVVVEVNRFCNIQCNFCFLEQDRTYLSYNDLINNITRGLQEAHNLYDIEEIRISGGEPSLLLEDTYNTILRICKRYTNNIIVETNLVAIRDFIIDSPVKIVVGFDNGARPQNIQQYVNMSKMTREFDMQILSTPYLQTYSPNYLIKKFARELPYLKNVYIKRYEPYIHRVFNVPDEKHEQMVKNFMISPLEKRFTLQNVEELDRFANDPAYVPNDVVYISYPTGELMKDIHDIYRSTTTASSLKAVRFVPISDERPEYKYIPTVEMIDWYKNIYLPKKYSYGV